MTRNNIPKKSPQQSFAEQMLSPFSFRWFLLTKLPTVLFWGVNVKTLTAKHCVVHLPYTWRTKNPFKSIYFAALSGAAELASGAICMYYLRGTGRYSMLITGFEADFLKKATQTTVFTCEEGPRVDALLKSLTEPDQTASLKMQVTATNKDGEQIAAFRILWSFKRKH